MAAATPLTAAPIALSVTAILAGPIYVPTASVHAYLFLPEQPRRRR